MLIDYPTVKLEKIWSNCSYLVSRSLFYLLLVNVEESEPPVLADLEKLSIKELKQLLDQRGIMYYSKSSKEDLIIAVNISGIGFVNCTNDCTSHSYN